MQIVDMLVRKYSQEERDGILRTSVEGGNGADIPACTADEIALAVGQLIGEMEKMEQVRLMPCACTRAALCVRKHLRQ